MSGTNEDDTPDLETQDDVKAGLPKREKQPGNDLKKSESNTESFLDQRRGVVKDVEREISFTICTEEGEFYASWSDLKFMKDPLTVGDQVSFEHTIESQESVISNVTIVQPVTLRGAIVKLNKEDGVGRVRVDSKTEENSQSDGSDEEQDDDVYDFKLKKPGVVNPRMIFRTGDVVDFRLRYDPERDLLLATHVNLLEPIDSGSRCSGVIHGKESKRKVRAEIDGKIDDFSINLGTVVGKKLKRGDNVTFELDGERAIRIQKIVSEEQQNGNQSEGKSIHSTQVRPSLKDEMEQKGTRKLVKTTENPLIDAKKVDEVQNSGSTEPESDEKTSPDTRVEKALQVSGDSRIGGYYECFKNDRFGEYFKTQDPKSEDVTFCWYNSEKRNWAFTKTLNFEDTPIVRKFVDKGAKEDICEVTHWEVLQEDTSYDASEKIHVQMRGPELEKLQFMVSRFETLQDQLESGKSIEESKGDSKELAEALQKFQGFTVREGSDKLDANILSEVKFYLERDTLIDIMENEMIIPLDTNVWKWDKKFDNVVGEYRVKKKFITRLRSFIFEHDKKRRQLAEHERLEALYQKTDSRLETWNNAKQHARIYWLSTCSISKSLSVMLEVKLNDSSCALFEMNMVRKGCKRLLVKKLYFDGGTGAHLFSYRFVLKYEGKYAYVANPNGNVDCRFYGNQKSILKKIYLLPDITPFMQRHAFDKSQNEIEQMYIHDLTEDILSGKVSLSDAIAIARNIFEKQNRSIREYDAYINSLAIEENNSCYLAVFIILVLNPEEKARKQSDIQNLIDYAKRNSEKCKILEALRISYPRNKNGVLKFAAEFVEYIMLMYKYSDCLERIQLIPFLNSLNIRKYNVSVKDPPDKDLKKRMSSADVWNLVKREIREDLKFGESRFMFSEAQLITSLSIHPARDDVIQLMLGEAENNEVLMDSLFSDRCLLPLLQKDSSQDIWDICARKVCRYKTFEEKYLGVLRNCVSILITKPRIYVNTLSMLSQLMDKYPQLWTFEHRIQLMSKPFQIAQMKAVIKLAFIKFQNPLSEQECADLVAKATDCLLKIFHETHEVAEKIIDVCICEVHLDREYQMSVGQALRKFVSTKLPLEVIEKFLKEQSLQRLSERSYQIVEQKMLEVKPNRIDKSKFESLSGQNSVLQVALAGQNSVLCCRILNRLVEHNFMEEKMSENDFRCSILRDDTISRVALLVCKVVKNHNRVTEKALVWGGTHDGAICGYTRASQSRTQIRCQFL